jgi:drug/metabolite transporter (DMT)-like permease
MAFLWISILTSTLLVVILKLFPRFQINTFLAIVTNYIVCSSMGFYFVPANVEWYHPTQGLNWLYVAIGMGFSFIALFNLMGYISQELGLTAVSVSNKLSLIIPVGLAFFIYGDSVTWIKLTGLLLAIPAVLLTTWQDGEGGHKWTFKNVLLFTLLFIGSGLNDTFVKFAQEKLMTESQFPLFTAFVFGMAFVIGVLIALFLAIRGKLKFTWQSVVAGIALGIPNYFSIYALLKALAVPNWESSTLFTINNVGILLASALMGVVIFKERLSIKNIIGILVACISIILLADKLI